MKLRIRIDDVLQTENFSYWQMVSLKYDTMFDWFKYFTRHFQDYPFILAVVAEGIDKEPNWVKYIKQHPNWEVQCHGLTHRTYTAMDLESIKKDLSQARKKLEETFGCYVTKFYPPKMKYNDMTREAARQVGLEEVRERYTVKHYIDKKVPEDAKEIYCHYWNPLSTAPLWQVLAEGS